MQFLFDTFLGFDKAVAGYVGAHVAPSATSFFTFFTHLGSVEVVVLLSLGVLVLLWRRHREFLAPFLLAMGGSVASMWLLKHLIARPRPLGGLIPESGFAFPSGHATAGMAFAVFMVWFLAVSRTRTPQQRPVVIIFGVLLIITALLIGTSRIYLGVHYASDVLGGFVLGLLWVAISGLFLNIQSD